MPSDEDLCTYLSQCLRKNGMEFVLAEENGILTLTIAIPRFLTKTYDVCAVNADYISDCVCAMMLRNAGKTKNIPCAFSE